MIDNNKLVSVVMPVHNGERFLREAIESVLNQTYSNFELLIIENCSTDKSLEIVQSYDDPRIRIIISKNCGQVDAYNRGFIESLGEYIFIHDQDDISHSERFMEQLNLMNNSDIDICGSFFNVININGKIIGKQILPTIDNDIKEQLLYKNYAMFNSSVCMKKNIFYKYGLFDKTYYPSSDYEFYLRVKNNCKYYNISKYLYNWRRYKNQISNILRKETITKSKDISLKYLEKEYKNLERQTYYFQKGLINYYNNYLINALYYFLKSLFLNTNHPKKLYRYLFLIIIFGAPIKILRYTSIVHSQKIISCKNYFDKYLFISSCM